MHCREAGGRPFTPSTPRLQGPLEQQNSGLPGSPWMWKPVHASNQDAGPSPPPPPPRASVLCPEGPVPPSVGGGPGRPHLTGREKTSTAEPAPGCTRRLTGQLHKPALSFQSRRPGWDAEPVLEIHRGSSGLQFKAGPGEGRGGCGVGWGGNLRDSRDSGSQAESQEAEVQAIPGHLAAGRPWAGA